MDKRWFDRRLVYCYTSPELFRGSSVAEQLAVNETVVGPTPTPGAN